MVDGFAVFGLSSMVWTGILKGIARIVYWSKRQGIITHHDDDPVRYYAFADWLNNNAHPVFATLVEAENYAADREWPRLD